MLRPTDCTGTPFEKLQYLPTDGRPVTTWNNRDEAFLDIARGLRKVVEEFRSTQEQETAASRRQYCDKLYEHWHMLDFKGIMHGDMNRPMSIPLTEVFVLPDVLVGVPEDETIEREEAGSGADDKAGGLGVDEDGEVVTEYYVMTPEGWQLRKAAQTREKRIVRHREDLPTVVAKHRRLIILGDPGSGKSTLLRQIMLLLAQGDEAFSAVFPQLAGMSSALPLYIPLAAYAESWLSTAPGERSLKQFLPKYLCEHYLDIYVDLLYQELEQGNVFVLLDGLDEIPDASLRMQIVRHVETFTQSFPKNRFIITSRIVGYKEAPLAAPKAGYGG
jgi:hypothetical protein